MAHDSQVQANLATWAMPIEQYFPSGGRRPGDVAAILNQ
jgi:hypothetical protein